ncbi:MAG TPA: hypothetical protein VGK34_04175, partial [Armatimonadota bacterium]
EEFRSRLDQVGANVVGAVLNMARPEDSNGYYHFRSAYSDLLRNEKHMQALPGITRSLPASFASEHEEGTDES